MADGLELSEPINFQSLLSIVYQLSRCCYFSKTKTNPKIDYVLEKFKLSLTEADIKDESIIDCLNLMLTDYKMAMMLSILKDHSFVSEVLIKLLKRRSICNIKSLSISGQNVVQYLNNMISLISTNKNYLESGLVLLKFITDSKLYENLEIMQKYFYFLSKSQKDSIDCASLQEFSNYLNTNTSQTQNFMDLTALVGKTLSKQLSNLKQADVKTVEIVLKVVSQLIQILRKYENNPDLKLSDELCKECNNVKRHIMINLIYYLNGLISIVGKQKKLSDKTLDKYIALLEYGMTTVLDGLKCSVKKQMSLSFLVFIFNMVVTWKFYSK